MTTVWGGFRGDRCIPPARRRAARQVKHGARVVPFAHIRVSVFVRTTGWPDAMSLTPRSACLALLALLGSLQLAEAATLIKGGTVVNADTEFAADVLIEGEIVTAVGAEAVARAAALEGVKEVDAKGMYVVPGGIDPHTHLAMPFMGQVAIDDFNTGHRAALAGGTTMHVDFALPVDGSLKKGLAEWHTKGSKAVMDFGFHMAVTSWSDEVAAELKHLAETEGVNSFKFFLAYKGALMVTDEELVAGLRQCAAVGALPMVHAENGDAVAVGQAEMMAKGVTGPAGHALSRPKILEAEATGRALRLAHFADAPLYVVHVMSDGAAAEVVAAKTRGQRVVGEPVTSGLVLDESMMWHEDFNVAAQYVMSPPIRQRAVDGEALRKALSSGLLDLVATDHAVFNSKQKAKGKGDFRILPNGVNGIEERMPVVWGEMVATGEMSRSRFVEVTSTAAAKIFNVYPKKGAVRVGSDADIAIIDPTATTTISAKTHHSAMDTNVYEGRSYPGRVAYTFSRGRLMWADGKLTDECKPGSGKFVPMAPFAPQFYAGKEGVSEREEQIAGLAKRYKDEL